MYDVPIMRVLDRISDRQEQVAAPCGGNRQLSTVAIDCCPQRIPSKKSVDSNRLPTSMIGTILGCLPRLSNRLGFDVMNRSISTDDANGPAKIILTATMRLSEIWRAL